MFVLGLGHKARHGKDYLGKTIVQHCAARGLYAKTYGFADALRAYWRVAFGMREKDAPLLQIVGTDIFRKRNPDIWVRVLEDTIREQESDVAIVTDMRFPNEMRMIMDAFGGKTIKVTRLNTDGTPYVAQDRDPNHPSETALDGVAFDRTVVAAGGDIHGLIEDGIDCFESLWEEHRCADSRV